MSTLGTVARVLMLSIALPMAVRADSLASGSWTIFFDPGGASQTLAGPGSSSGVLPADALINFGASGYSEASVLATGTAQPWYLSPAVSQAYGHTPSASEQSAFASRVLTDIDTTYALAGLSPRVTIDPNAPANHTISVVSGLSYAGNAGAIGITDVGHDGFGFIDKLKYASSPDELAWAVAHNVAHELMHAFGVGIHTDQTGQYLDAASATWALLTDPNSGFSPGAAKLIGATNFGASLASSSVAGKAGLEIDGGQEILAVPEPTTLAAWSVVALGAVYVRRRTAPGVAT